jgi:preprotein translocase subunit SecA
MAQRDPLVEYQREGFDMFAAMMDAIKEESVGFLFNLEVQVDEDAAPAAAPAPTGGVATPEIAPAEGDDGEPQLDLALLEAAQEQHEAAGGNGKPRINAKGLERSGADKPLTYIAPELGSDTPAVQTSGGGEKAPSGSATARRQQARSNPNRGSRGNRSKRKR